jgi:phage-related minor tail protein
MAIIKRKDIYEGGKAFSELTKEIDDLTLSVKELQKQTREMNKSGSGSEAKERLNLAKQLTTQTNKLVVAETQQAKELARAKVELQQKNKENKQAAILESKLTGEYQKQSTRLNKLRKAYKDLILEEGKSTKATIKLRNEITKLDSKLKAVDKSVGQSQRKVGQYGDALKGVGTQLLGAAGITVGLSAVVQGMTAVAQRAGTLIDATKKIEQTFNETGGAAKKLAANVVALANNFDEDYNEILKAANTVSKELGISATEALENIEEGFLKGSNNTGEFLEILKEYPAQFEAAGIDADTMFSIINQQVKEGIYSDKGVDAIKEGGLRLRENTKAVQEALAPLDESIRLQIEQEVAAGNSFKAIQLVSGALKDNSLTASETQAIVADVFGGAGEDAGLRYLQMLSDIEGNLENVAIQATASEQANLNLSKSWNEFVANVFSDSGVLSNAWASLKDGLGFLLQDMTTLFKLAGGGESALDKVTSAIERQTKALENEDEQLKAVNTSTTNLTGSVTKLTAAQKKQLKLEKEASQALDKERKKREAARKENEELLKEIGMAEAPTSVQVDPNAGRLEEQKALYDAGIISEKEYQDKLYELRFLAGQKDLDNQILNLNTLYAQKKISTETFETQLAALKLEKEKLSAEEIGTFLTEKAEEDRAKKLEKTEEEAQEDLELLQAFEDAKNDIKEGAIDAFGQFASNANQQVANDKIEQSKQDNKIEQDLLKDKLQKGQITEAQFKRQSDAANKKARQEQAKAQRDAALFDIAISTAVGVIKAIANTGLPAAAPLVVATIALGALNAALVLSQPLPKFAKGEVGIKGKSHAQGGKNVNIEGGESIITTEGTTNAPGLLTAINEGMISDNDLPALASKGLTSSIGLSPERSNNDNFIAHLLMQGNKKSDKMITAMLNGVSQYESNGTKHIIFADGRHLTSLDGKSYTQSTE